MPNTFKAFAPGRTEIAGNHVDHQHGVAVTGSLKQGISANVELRDDNIIRFESEGFEPFEVDITSVPEPKDYPEDKHYTTESMVAGVANAFLKRNIPINGFTAKATSTIGSGMGLSSSAACELLIAVILNDAYNDGKLSKMELAQIGQYAECKYFNKPCGLLDQTAISYGGIIQIDFEDPENLKVNPIDFDFDKQGLGAVLVDSGAQHGDISDMYAAIPGDIKKVANMSGVNFLRELDDTKFMWSIKDLRKKVGDKQTMRAIHFYHEHMLTLQRIEALKAGNTKLFTHLHGVSGTSSAEFLQNIKISDENQAATICQAICELCLDYCCRNNFENRGASRIHGGGFGGCIQVFLPKEQLEDFVWCVNEIYGKEVATQIEFSSKGAHTNLK